jgi:hypothetical protein
MTSLRAVRRPEEPVRPDLAEFASGPRPLVRRLGRVRVPLSLSQRPWATAYRLPSGQTIWCLRLWTGTRTVPVVLTTAALRRYAQQSRFRRLVAAVDAIAAPDGA